MPGADIARRANLSAQTVSVILRKLEVDGLLAKGTPQRGRVGKPSVPINLNNTGAYSFGAKIGRRSSHLVLMDFSGRVCGELIHTHAYPTPGEVTQFLSDSIEVLAKQVEARESIAGIGIAAPYQLWSWLDVVGAPKRAMKQWKDFDFTESIANFSDLKVYVGNDATLACNAEHVFGCGRDYSDYAYFYIGTFAGGGMVLGDCVYQGRNGNAAAFGSLPVGNTKKPEHQLIHNASLYLLERAINKKGMSSDLISPEQKDWSDLGSVLDKWIDQTAESVAKACATVCSVIDFEAVIIDGRFPQSVRARLIEQVKHNISGIDTQGIDQPNVVEGTIGVDAAAIGAAYQPIVQNYLIKSAAHL